MREDAMREGMNADGWKFLNVSNTGEIVSAHDSTPWTIGEWREVKGQIEACRNGFHCSPNPLDALIYVKGTVVARVEVDGESHEGCDKSAHQRMRIVQAWRWTAQDSVKLAIFAAEQALSVYEVWYPGDDRPRAAIEAAKAYAVSPSSDSANAAARAAARAAADAARAAADDAAAYAADAADAAYAAYAAARAAADAAAYAAARAAAYAADAAANAEMRQRGICWMVAYIEESCEQIGATCGEEPTQRKAGGDA